jgi:endoglycosylceramidase
VRRAAVGCVVAAAAVLLAVPAGASIPRHAPETAAAQPPQLRRDGRWLVDQRGRVVILHGLNAVWKHAPYFPPDTAEGFTAKDADLLAANGFNAVRLGVLFAGVMPTEGVIDAAYLNRIDRVVDLLAARHIWVMLDFHQDDYSEKFTGEGFPAWAIHDDGIPFTPTGTFFTNYFTPALMRVFDNLWENAGGVRDRYAQAWAAVAQRFRDQPYLMGYDLINEPSGGSQMLSCFNPAGCPVFDATLQDFQDRVRAEIRKKDPANIVWFEPHFFFNAIARSNFTKVADAQVGFSWHLYACTPAFTGGSVIPGDPDCELNEPMVVDHADAQIAAMGATGLLSEFGSNDDVTDLARMTRLADEHLYGWLYWAYKAWHDPTGNPASEGLFAKDNDLSTLKAPKADVLIRAYPQAVAGVPTSLAWDSAAKTMTLTYTPKAGVGNTEVFVPARHYAGRFAVDVTGADVVSRTTTRVVVANGAGATSVRVVVRPGEPSTGHDFDDVDGGTGGGPGDGSGDTDGGSLAGTGGLPWSAAAVLLVTAAGAIRRRPDRRR